MAASDFPVLSSSIAIERALSRFGWLGDYDETLVKIGITRDKLRALDADDEISAALDTRREACINTPWRFEHPSARVRRFFDTAFAPVVDTLLVAFWQAVPYGYAPVEVVYRELAGRIVPATVLDLPFEWFRLLPDGRMLWRESGEDADPRKFFRCVHRGALRKPHGEALLAKAYWPWFFRVHGWKFWAKFLEQASVPLLMGKTQGDRQALLEQLQRVTSGPAMAVSDLDSVTAVDLPGNSPNKFSEFETAIQRRIQRLILGQTLTSGTDGGSGNRALGEVHNEVRMEKRRADVRIVMASVQSVVDCVAALNGMEPPEFVMEDGSGLQRDRAERDKLIVESGMLRFTETYLREKYGFEPDDFTLPESAPAAAPPPADQAAPAALAARPFTFADGSKPERPRFTAGQQVIEDEIERTLPQLASPLAAAAIQAAIRGARDAEDLYERLSVALRDADDREFRQAFERALFAADLIGYGQAQAAGRRAVDREGQGGDLAAVPPINIHATLQMPEQAPQPIAVTLEAPPAPAIQIDVHVPEAPAPVVNLAAPEITVTPEITVKAFPERAVQTVERDEAGEIVRTITAYEDGA